MLLNEIQSYYASLQLAPNSTLAYQRNKLKEFLHLYILNFIYKRDVFRDLIFYGGTCLRHCFNLPRLSEDLDFEYLNGSFPFDLLEQELKKYFSSELKYGELVTKIQKFRIYLKFPVLAQLRIVSPDESEFLHLKIEINQTTHEAGTYAIETHPFFGMQQTFFIKRYDLSTLMASKLNALIARTWTRNNKQIGEISTIKGRDYFDLLWYMARKVAPRITFTKFTSPETLWGEISKRVSIVKESHIENDLVDFLDNPSEAREFAANFKQSFTALMRANY